MLKGVDRRLTADVLYALRAMLHGDYLVVVDTSFPAESVARETVLGDLLRMDNLSAAEGVAVSDAVRLGCATAGMFGIPTVGFGPADELHSHTVNDQIPLAQLGPAMAFFAMFPQIYLESSDQTK